ncbi:hypothetical protein GOODEAATRI_008223 [Goodea atripinnis]|uniref:C2H2-type domain-containing protein n=1 Tax=Goodea atripinnis TaxID=208336 RepID=A0ABV0MQC3_9TELE
MERGTSGAPERNHVELERDDNTFYLQKHYITLPVTFGGCGQQFESLAELIVHIEDNHIGELGPEGGGGASQLAVIC